jgi:DHA1 family tetracycline resistance protein-like MFS transporter
MAQGRSAALKFIFITVLIDVVGWGLIIPVMPDLLGEMLHIPANATSTYGGWLLFVYAFMQFICAPILGGLSDRYGRRPVLLISLFGFGIDYLFLAFAPTFAWLFVGRVISGITGASFWIRVYHRSCYWRPVKQFWLTCAFYSSRHTLFAELLIWVLCFTRIVR